MTLITTPHIVYECKEDKFFIQGPSDITIVISRRNYNKGEEIYILGLQFFRRKSISVRFKKEEVTFKYVTLVTLQL